MSELKRWFQHVRGEPAMCLAPTVDRMKRQAYVICLSAAFKYTEPEYMLKQCGVIVDMFDLGGFSSQRLARIAAFIEDGLDELVAMPPESIFYATKPKVIGEGELFVGGNKATSFEVTDQWGQPNAN